MPVILPPGVVLRPAVAAQNLVQPTGDAVLPLSVRAFSPTQSAKLQEWQTSAGTAIASVDAVGTINVGQQATTPNIIGGGYLTGGVSCLNVQRADFNPRRFEFWPDAGGGSTSMLLLKQNASTCDSALQTDANNSLISLAINAPTIPGGTVDAAKAGGYFRLDTRLSGAGLLNGDQAFIIFGGLGGVSTCRFVVSLMTGDALLAPGSSGAVMVGATIPATTTRLCISTDINTTKTAACFQGGTNAQTAPLIELDQISSTTMRAVGFVDGAFAVSTDATRQGRVLLSAAGFNGSASEGMRVEGDGTGAGTKIGFFGGTAVVKQVGASAAGIAAITDANAKAAISALQNALAAYNLVTAPA